MLLDDSISHLIGDIYASPVDESAWKRVLDQLLWRTGSRFLLVSAVDLRSKQFTKAMTYGADDGRFLDGVEEYERDWYVRDPLLSYAARFPNAGFVESRDALRALGRSPDDDPYLHFAAGQLGVGHNAVSFTSPANDLTLGISINLPAGVDRFAPEHLQMFRLLFDHLQRATWLAARPPDLVSEKDAVILLNERGYMVSANGAAEAIFAKCDGLLSMGKRLCSGRPDDTRRIDALIANTLAIDTPGGGGGALAVERPSGQPAWLLSADYIPSGSSFLSKFGAKVVIRIIERPLRSSPEMLTRTARLFGLTRTEARVLNAVYADNLDLRDAADQLELTYATARVHMRRILGKADVRTQAALSRLIQKLEG